MTYYVGTKEECDAINAKISENCGWPSGGTTDWAISIETTQPGVYAIVLPGPEGSHGFTREEMMKDIDTVEVETVQFPEVEGEQEP